MPADPAYQPDPGSFRDPTSRVLVRGRDIFRTLSETALADFETVEGTAFFKAALADGRIIATERSDERIPGNPAAVLRHERVPVVTYPYEWTFTMLRDAALLQLELLGAALEEGVTSKDASSYNVQFHGAQPTFIDVGSFEKSRPGEPWYGYRQFCELFLYPLMLQAYKDVPFHTWLRGSVDGISPQDMHELMSLRDHFRKGVFTHVHLHAKLQAKYGDSRRDVKGEVAKAGFKDELVKANVRRLTKVVGGLQWKAAASEWADYRADNSYDDADTAAKVAFVEKVCAGRPRTLVWDVGANDGRFSRIAAEHSELVLALDADHLVVDRLYQTLRRENERRILPLVMDLANPSPGLGWRGVERRPLADRGRPDLVLCLAVIHHLAISRMVPLSEFTGWLAGLGGEVVIEFPTRDDPQVQRLLRNKRAGIFDNYDVEPMERALADHFTITGREELPSGRRILYSGTPRRSTA